MNRAEKKQKQQLLLQLSDCYEEHDALHVKHAPGTYLQCACCQKIIDLTAAIKRLEVVDRVVNTEPEKETVSTESDAVRFERLQDWLLHFTVAQYKHLRESGMTEKEIIELLDIPVELFRHWKMVQELECYTVKIYEVLGVNKRKYYYKALNRKDLNHVLLADKIAFEEIQEIANEDWDSFYVPLSDEDSYTTLKLLADQVVLGWLITLEPDLAIEIPKRCELVGQLEVLTYDGTNGGQVVQFVKPHQAQIAKKGKPIQLQVKGKGQTSIKPGMYIVKNALSECFCYTSEEFFSLYQLKEGFSYSNATHKGY